MTNFSIFLLIGIVIAIVADISNTIHLHNQIQNERGKHGKFN